MGKRKSKKLYCFLGQLCYKHKRINECVIRMMRALDELEETLKKCPVKKKKKK